MLARWLFAIRSFGADLGPRLGSWRLSVVLMVLAALYYGLLAIWSTSSPPHVVQSIAGLAPFWGLYILLLMNTGVCLWRRLPTLGRELAERPRSWDALGSFLFHGAFFFVALGFLLTLAVRQEARVWVAVGETFTGHAEQYLSQSPPKILAAGVPAPGFSVERITPAFWRDEMLFTTLEAELQLADGQQAVTRINRPLWLGWGTFLRLSGFGYAPRYQLTDRHGQAVESAFVKLDVFPPGQRDYFSPPGYPHRLYVEVFPDFAVEEGDPVTRSLNLANPAVGLSVYRGRFSLGEAVLGREASFEFEGLRLSFPEIRYWGEFSIVRDPGVPLIFLAFALGLVGLLVRLAQ
jgi:hypothetical protein